MKKEVAQKWVEALRSGNYEQTTGRLQTSGNRFCCLGVLQGPVLGLPISIDHDGTLSDVAVEQAGMHSDLGVSVKGNNCSLSSMNDVENRPFTEIADYIEANYENL